MKKIYSKIEPDNLLTIVNRLSDINSERAEMADENEPLQGSAKKLQRGEKFKPHSHNVLHRETSLTQEAWIVIRGEILVSLYDLDNTLIHKEVLSEGDCVLNFRAGHTFETLKDDTILYEFKNGPYMGVEADKTLIPENES